MDKVYHHLRRLHRAISILFPFMPLKIANSNDNRPSIYNQCRIESFIMSHYLWLMVYDSWFMTCLKSIEQFLWSKKWPREYSDQWSKTQSTTKNDHWVLEQKWVQIRWGASFRWIFGPNNPYDSYGMTHTVWGSKETTNLHRFSCITIKESDNSRNNQNNLENTFSSFSKIFQNCPIKW